MPDQWSHIFSSKRLKIKMDVLVPICMSLKRGERKYVVIDDCLFRLTNLLGKRTTVLKSRCSSCDKLIVSSHECFPLAKRKDRKTKLWKGLGLVPYDICFVDKDERYVCPNSSYEGVTCYHYDTVTKRVREEPRRRGVDKGMHGHRPKKIKVGLTVFEDESCNIEEFVRDKS